VDPHSELSTGPATSRIAALDVLRGVALLGILVMNLPATALTEYAFFNPSFDGGFTGIDYLAWLGSHLLFELKMMAIFSMLFGAGIAMIAERFAQRHRRPGLVIYRRLFFLLVIGMLHAYLIWWGDILVGYALIGMMIYPLRKLRPRTLIVLGGLLMLVAIPINVLQGFLFGSMRSAFEAQQQGLTLQPWQEGMAKGWPGTAEGFVPSPQALQEESDAVLGGYLSNIQHRAIGVVFMQTWIFLTWMLWRVSGLMLLGMALYKLGVVTGRCSTRTYARMCVVGYVIGLPIVLLGVSVLQQNDFDFIFMFTVGWHFNYVGSVAVALGHIGLIMLAVRFNWLGLLARPLAAVGRTALTNYLMQSVLMILIFTGAGLGLFRQLDRAPLLLIVLAIWIAQLAFSTWWLQHYRFGPAEWLWRSLTYLRLQPLRR
jgi:uncharacterized protein